MKTIRSVLAAIRTFLVPGKFFVDDDEASDRFEFPHLDRDMLRAQLELDRKAADLGGHNIPSPSQAQPDSAEQEIEDEVTKRVAQAKTRAIEQIDHIQTAIQARQLAPKVMRCWEIPQKLREELETENHRIDSELEGLTQRLEDLEQEVTRYRTQYSIGRGPRLVEAEDRNQALALLILFTLVQLFANAILFGQGSDYGLSFGLGLAAILAFFDILLHFNVGRLAARLQAPDTRNKWLGRLGATVALVAVPLWNLGLVHLRLVTREHGVSGWDYWLLSLTSDPWGFRDFISWALFAVGGLCSILALVSGWLWDEPIPLYRENGRWILRLRADIGELTGRKRSLVSDLKQRYLEELERIERDAEHYVALIAGHVKRTKRLVRRFDTYKAEAAQTYQALVRIYRDENRRRRSSRPPVFFDGPANLELEQHRLEVSVDSFNELEEQARADWRELKALLPDVRQDVLTVGRSTEAEQ